MLHKVSPEWVRLEFTKNILFHPCYIAVSVRNMTLITSRYFYHLKIKIAVANKLYNEHFMIH